MEWCIILRTTEEGNIESGVGVGKISPIDMLRTNITLSVIHPPPEGLQALKDLIVQAKREDQG